MQVTAPRILTTKKEYKNPKCKNTKYKNIKDKNPLHGKYHIVFCTGNIANKQESHRHDLFLLFQ